MTSATTTTATEQQELARTAWTGIAAGYDTFVSDSHVRLANEALTRVGLSRGERFLDVAAGCGALSLPAARRGASVVATDWAPGMINALEARARREGVTLEARLMDCHALDLGDNSVDVCGSQFGVMLVPDQPLALREMVRITRPGGRVLLIAYGPPGEIEFLQFFAGALQAVDPTFAGVPASPPPLEFQAADPAVLRQRLADAGLKAITIDTVTEQLEFRSGLDFWNWVLNSNPLAGVLTAHLTDSQRADMRGVLDGMIGERSNGAGPAILADPVHIAIGTK